MILDGKYSQKYSFDAVVSQGSIPGRALFLQCINDLPHYVICNIAIYADNGTL